MMKHVMTKLHNGMCCCLIEDNVCCCCREIMKI